MSEEHILPGKGITLYVTEAPTVSLETGPGTNPSCPSYRLCDAVKVHNLSEC